MSGRTVQWKSNAQFNFGPPTKNNIAVTGSGESACLQLSAGTPNSDDVPFTTPANYTYDGNKIVVVDGKAKLKATIAGETNYPFTTPVNYTYDLAKIEVVGDVAKLTGTPVMPYAWYHLNESSGVTASDSSGNGRHGTLTNMEESDWQVGKLNNCLVFDGLNEYVNCGDIAGFERTDPFSVEAWIKTTTTGPQSIVTKGMPSSPYTGWRFYLGNNVVAAILYGNNTGHLQAYSLATVCDGLWHHVVVTYDGSVTTAGFKIYVDGVSLTTIKGGTLTGSILTTIPCTIGILGGSGVRFKGSIDEVVIYDFVLTPSDVADRWNSGTGTESPLGKYFIDNPGIYPDIGFVFNSPIGEFAETVTKPIETQIKYHVSSDDGVTWKYWNGTTWVVTDDTYVQANTVIEVNTNITVLASSGTFKFRALLHSDTGIETPEIDNIYIAEGVSYIIGDWPIEMNTDIQPSNVLEYISVTETVTKPIDTDIKYQYSIDGGLIWNGSWFTEPQLETAIKLISCSFDGTDKIRFKIQLSTTDNIKTPQIDNLNINSHSGYKTSGDYTSTVFNVYSVGQWGVVGWEKLIFDVVTPINTIIIIKQRTSSYELDEHGEFEVVVSGAELDTESNIFQFKVEMTGNGRDTPKLNLLEVEYCLGIYCKEKIADAVWDRLLTEPQISGSAGAELNKMRIALGLLQNNFKMYNQVYDSNNNMTTANIRIYPTAADANADTNHIKQYSIVATYNSDGNLIDYVSVEA